MTEISPTPAPDDQAKLPVQASTELQAQTDAPRDAEPTPAQAATTVNPAEVAARLKSLFPALFAGGYKPLKLRVQADIQERAPGQFSKAQLSAFLRKHTGSTGYLISLTKAKHRFDLDGQPGDELSDEHRKVAQEELTRRRGLQREREALAEQQYHNRANLLRDYERTTLTVANFCALKGVTEAELPGLLEIARKEAAERPPEPERRGPRPEQRRDQRNDQRNDGRRDERPRHKAGGRPGGKPGSKPPSR